MQRLWAKGGLITTGGLVLLLATPAIAAPTMTIDSTGVVAPRDRSRAAVTISVECWPDEGQSSEGTATVTLQQSQRVGTVVGSGSTAVTCDNILRDYVVTLISDTGQFAKGEASVSGETTFPYSECVEHPETGRSCERSTLRMVASEQPITLVYRNK